MLILPLALAAIMSAVPEAARGIAGIVQNAQGKKLEKSKERPISTTPLSVQEALDYSRAAAANVSLPGQAGYNQNIESSTANAFALAKEYGGSPDVASLMNNEMEAKNNLMIQTAGYNAENKRNLMNMLLTTGEYEKQNWDYNQRQSYDETMAMAAQKKEAGNQNTFEAIKNLSTIGITAMNGMLDKGRVGSGGGVGDRMAAERSIPGIGTQRGQSGIDVAPEDLGQLYSTLKNLGWTDDKIAQFLTPQ